MTEEPSAAKQISSIVSSQAGGVADALLRIRAGDVLESFKAQIEDRLKYVDLLCSVIDDHYTKGKLSDIEEDLWNRLVSDTGTFLDEWKVGIGLGMGTAIAGLDEQFRLTPQILSILKTTQLNICALGPMEKYWRRTYPRTGPDEKTAFQMYMKGDLSRAEFGDKLLDRGWSTKWHDKLYSFYTREPDIFLAMDLWNRGLIKEADLKILFKMAGYDEKWHDKLKVGLKRRPTFRELTSLSDFVPITDSWVTEVLRAQGYLDTDIQYMLPAIRLRPLREEVRSVVGRYLWEFQTGRLDRDTLQTDLTLLGLLPKELELQMLWGDLRYADQLIDDQTSIIQERVYQNDPELIGATKEETIALISAELESIGYNVERSNLLAEYWYWWYVY
jgi:hypothetical protein